MNNLLCPLSNISEAQLDQLAQRAAAEEWSYSHFLGRLLEPELAARRQRVIETNLRLSDRSAFKPCV
jgi:hypothetical protein